MRFAIGIVTGLLWAGGAGGQTRPSQGHIDALIQQLSDPDAARRKQAAGELVGIGSPARPAVARAMTSGDPGVSEQARQIILALPWYAQEDPPLVRAILLRYGTPDISRRQELANRLAELDHNQGLPALARIALQEPDSTVRWTIVKLLYNNYSLNLFAPFRTAEPAVDDAPGLALCGLARLNSDPARAWAMFRQCTDAEFASPTDYAGAFQYVVEMLANHQVQEKNFDQAADLQRKMLAIGGSLDDEQVPTALLDLYAVQADHGPLKGWEQDQQLAESLHANQSPKILYMLSVMDARLGNTQRAAAERDAAFNASTTSVERNVVAQFLADHNWMDLAKNECRKIIASPPDVANSRIDAMFFLSYIAVQQGNDLEAAQAEEQAVLAMGKNPQGSRISESGQRLTLSEADLWRDVQWHYFRAAVAAHHEPEISDRLAKLMAYKPTSPEIAMDVVPVLSARGQTAQAEALFTAAIKPLEAQLNADPNNAESLNAIAWFCAKCDQRLDDALAWSTESQRLEPDSAAIMDTLALVYYDRGDVASATDWEQRAVMLDPQNTYMIAQLKVYRAAAATRP